MTHDGGTDMTLDPAFDAAQAREFRKLTALVVEDSRSQRRLLAALLKRWNFDVLEAGSGMEALAICSDRSVDFIISDWMMPGMSGPELCRAVRGARRAGYVYFILLTAKSDKIEIAAGLDAGADDFMVKPPDADELHARLRAGQRLVRMQEALVDKNRRITEAFDRLNGLYEEMERDLRAAARLQRSLLPPPESRCGGVEIASLCRPMGHVGGDLLGYFPVGSDRIAAFAIDVSGHGVAAALTTARLSRLFAPHRLDENLAVERLASGAWGLRDPAAIAAELNRRMLEETDTDQYLTMLFADVNTATGVVRFCQAGHPCPAVVRRGGTVEFCGDGGPPIGLLPGLDYATGVIRLAAGEQLLLYSDGVTECTDPGGEMFDDAGLDAVLAQATTCRGRALLDQLVEAMEAHRGSVRFEDDVSALLLAMP